MYEHYAIDVGSLNAPECYHDVCNSRSDLADPFVVLHEGIYPGLSIYNLDNVVSTMRIQINDRVPKKKKPSKENTWEFSSHFGKKEW